MIQIKSLASGSKGNCYHITDGSTQLLLECGISIGRIKRGLNFRLSEVAGCLVSHFHKDHSKEVRKINQMGIDCYMSLGTAKELGIGLDTVQICSSQKPFKIGTWTILPFDVQHDAAEPFGYLLQNREGEKLLFATDTYYIKYRFEGLTHIMVECNYSSDILEQNLSEGLISLTQYQRLLQSHFCLDNVKNFLQANDLSKVQEIWLLHLSDRNSDETRFKREIQELTGKVVYIA